MILCIYYTYIYKVDKYCNSELTWERKLGVDEGMDKYDLYSGIKHGDNIDNNIVLNAVDRATYNNTAE